MKRRSLTPLLFSSLLVFLVACGGGNSSPIVQPPQNPPPQEGGNSISGTLTAPAGGDITGTAVGACVGENCIGAVTDASGNYSITGLAAGQYQIIAWKDVNGSGQVDVGDYAGIYTQDGQTAAFVTPPASGINMTLIVVNTTPTQ